MIPLSLPQLPTLTLPGAARAASRVGSGPNLTPEERQSELARLARSTGQFIESLGLVLDTPGAIVRGVLAGDPASGFSFDSDRRTSGAELLQAYGLDTKNKYLQSSAGLATEMVTDPLAWLTGPASALTKAGKAAKTAGLLDLAQTAALNRIGTGKALSTLQAGKVVDDVLTKGLIPKTAGNLAVARPVGPRYARATTTLQEIIDTALNKTDAEQRLVNALGSKAQLDALRGERLGGTFGFGFLNPAEAPLIPGSEKALDYLDSVGARIGYSAPARTLSSLFDERVAGFSKAGDQIAALRADAIARPAEAAARREASEHAAKLSFIKLTPAAKNLLGADSLLSAEGADFLNRYVEKPTPNDVILAGLIPELKDWKKSWQDIAQTGLRESQGLGLKVNKYKDKFGNEFTPRYGDEFDFEGVARSAFKSQFGVGLDQSFGRRNYMILPGGTQDLKDISVLPDIREFADNFPNSTKTEAEIGAIIKAFVQNKHPGTLITDKHAEKLARVMSRIKKDLPKDYPIFAAHPINSQSRWIVNNAMAQANAEFAFESLAEAAVEEAANRFPGGGYRTLDDALNKVSNQLNFRLDSSQNAAKVVQKQLRERIHAIVSKIDPTRRIDDINLGDFAVHESVVQRLTKLADFYQNPRAQEELAGFLNGYTGLMKSFLLAFPARFTRDSYSNAFSVWLETGSAYDTLEGMTAASQVLAGKWEKALPLIKQFPKYAGMGDEQAKLEFIKDVGGSGVLSGLASSDLLTSSRIGEISQLVPGAQPTAISTGLKELIPDGTRTPGQMVSDFFTIKGMGNDFQTRNPILNASQKIGDTIDSIGRLGGFMALLKRGTDVGESATRMKRALVDYGSLTAFERRTMRSIFPWWAYNSRIGKYVVENLAANPGGRYGQTIRTLNTLQSPDENTYIPRGMRERFAARIPTEALPEGLRESLGIVPEIPSYLVDLDIPGTDVLNLLQPAPTIGQAIQSTGSNLLSMTSPLIKGTFETATGYDVFRKQPKREINTPYDRVYQAMFGLPEQARLDPTFKTILENFVPGPQRTMSAVVGPLLDRRLPMPQRTLKSIINSLTGVKVENVTPQRILQDLQGLVAEELSPYNYSFSKTYTPPELFPFMPPDKQRLELLRQDLDKESRALRERRRQQGEFQSKTADARRG